MNGSRSPINYYAAIARGFGRAVCSGTGLWWRGGGGGLFAFGEMRSRIAAIEKRASMELPPQSQSKKFVIYEYNIPSRDKI